MQSDISSLGRIDDESFEGLIEIIFKFLLDPKEYEKLVSKLSEFAAEIGVGVGALKNVVRSLLAIFKSAGRKSIPPNFLLEDLEQLGMNSIAF